jgi:large subunit ribosomal protein L22
MLTQVHAKAKSAPISAKKIKPVIDLVRGKDLHEAKVVLSFDPTKAAKIVLKVLKSAEANARTNKNMDTSKLFISDIWAGPGTTRKSGRFAGRGRFSRILKRSSHVFVGLADKSVVNAGSTTVSKASVAVATPPKKTSTLAKPKTEKKTPAKKAPVAKTATVKKPKKISGEKKEK